MAVVKLINWCKVSTPVGCACGTPSLPFTIARASLKQCRHSFAFCHLARPHDDRFATRYQPAFRTLHTLKWIWAFSFLLLFNSSSSSISCFVNSLLRWWAAFRRILIIVSVPAHEASAQNMFRWGRWRSSRGRLAMEIVLKHLEGYGYLQGQGDGEKAFRW